jgi:ABC-type branched-subunit amino acid transport system ATPase component
MSALTADGITAGYGRVPIIRDIDIVAESATITAIVGPNGAGKSTLAKTLCGVLRPTTGRIWVSGKEVTGLPGHLLPRHGLAYVPQNENVFVSLSVRENLEIGGYPLRRANEAKIAEILAIFPDLAKAKDKRAGQLSGGQQNMLAMARALMVEPSVIVLDEPTAGLSPAYMTVVWEQIERVVATGTAAIVVEQNVERALHHARTVYVLVAGANHVHGPAEEIAALDLGAIFLGHDGSTR